jgi:hypothetical protein
LAVEGLVDHYRRTDTGDLSWMYGQGSVITGLTDDSDLDLILIWDEDVPKVSTLPGSSNLAAHGRLALEQSNLDCYDVDLMHVPRRTFESWMGELEGHYPPFPKYLPQWYERFGMNSDIRGLEMTYWATRDPAEGTAALESVAAAVLNLPEPEEG